MPWHPRADSRPAPNPPTSGAKAAYVYGFPIVDNYRVNRGCFVDRENPEFKAPWKLLGLRWRTRA